MALIGPLPNPEAFRTHVYVSEGFWNVMTTLVPTRHRSRSAADKPTVTTRRSFTYQSGSTITEASDWVNTEKRMHEMPR